MSDGEAEVRREGERSALDRFLEEHGVRASAAPLVRRAFIHRSYASENGLGEDNERLEFLGDAVVGWLVSEELFARLPGAPEGELTRQRAALVNRRQLGAIGVGIGLGARIRLGRGESKMGGRHRLSTIGNCLEALVGALYCEAGVDVARAFVRRFLVEEAFEVAGRQRTWHAKSRLQEWTQEHHRQTPTYRLLEQTGPDHEPSFRVEVLLGEEALAAGEGPRLKDAENAAAAAALERLQQQAGGEGEGAGEEAGEEAGEVARVPLREADPDEA